MASRLRPTRAVLVSVLFVATALVAFRIWWLPDFVVRQVAVTHPNGPERPSDLGLFYEDASFEIDGDRLEAWFVEPANPLPIAFLLFHGDGSTISRWVGIQKLLHDRGYPSLVYDYGGFGDSDGSPSTRLFREEPRRALDELLTRLSPESGVVLFGHSFGAAVAVEAFNGYDHPKVQGLVFHAGPPSLRQILVEVAGVPRLVAMLLPQVVNARVRVTNMSVPLLVIGSESDEVIAADWVRGVFERAPEPKDLLIRQTYSHNALLEVSDEWWAPVFTWVERLPEM